MALTETLLLQVGPAIAKTILRLWLKPIDAGVGLGTDIVDILKGKTSDVVAQQRAKRQFEAIGEKVAESLEPVFEGESGGLDEASRTAVAMAVASTLDQAKIDSTLLARRNLEPAELAKHLIGSDLKQTRHFSVAEKLLYERIIGESSRLIVDIASQLPSFTERTFSEVLKREDQLVNTTNQILKEVRRIRRNSQQFDQQAARFETEYRLNVTRNLDKLELLGVDVSAASRRHRLSVAYVTLSVRREITFPKKKSSHGQIPFFGRRTRQDRLVSLLESLEAEEQNAILVSVNQALQVSRRLFISGVAGSGKTTLLQWIAVRSALRGFPEELKGWNETIPFFVRLRQCVETELPAPQDLPRLVVPAIADAMPHEWVHKHLKSKHAVVLIDGVDEIPEVRRKQFYDWLEEQILAFPQTRFIVTSRPHAVFEEWLASHGFDFAELQPMDLSAIDEFIDHWHNAAREEMNDPDDIAELESLPPNLKSALRRNRSIRNLATNPLLCAMLCALYRDRRRQLPSDRIELYEAGCSMLLERRDVERRVELRDYPSLAYRQKRVLMQDLAYWMLKNGWSEVERGRAEERLNRRLTNMEGVPKEANGSVVYRFFVERSGIVREPIAGKIDFIHRTFQEFLAAHAALDEGDRGLLVRNAHDDQWREVIILSAGLARPKEREGLINALIARGDKEKIYRHRLYLLAIACLEIAIQIAPEVRVVVQKRMKQLIPPKNTGEVEALASAGELAVPYLASRPKLPAHIAAACVRALISIGGDAALETLAGYAADERQVVLAGLLHGWDTFDHKAYVERVLARITTLELERASGLSVLEYLTNLSKLEIQDCKSLVDLNSLAKLPNMECLHLWNCELITDLAPLGSLTKLSELDLSGCSRVINLKPLSGLVKLTYLDLSLFEDIRDLSPIAGLVNLTWLNLAGCWLLNDLNPLVTLKNLHELNLRDCVRITDIGPLSQLTNLEVLNLSGCNEIGDVSSLSTLKRLTKLNLAECSKIRDLSPLQKLGNLNEVKTTGIPTDIAQTWIPKGKTIP